MLEFAFIGFATVVMAGILLALVKTKKQTAKMKLQNQEIEKRLKEVEQRNDELQKNNQEKVQLISLVSHDLKAPFNRIFALTQLLNSNTENFSDEQKEYLSKINQIAIDGARMVGSIVESRKLDEKSVGPSQIEFDLSAFLLSIVKNYRTLAEKKKIKIIFEQETPVIIEADKLYLGRAIENLLSNAVKFSPENKKVFLSITSSSAYTEVLIKDEGPGISKEDQLKLFRRFQQLTARPTGGESSSGLGLFIVKSITDKIGAEVFCESVLGQGAIFTLRLPNKVK